MKLKWREIIPSFLITLAVLVVLEVLTTTIGLKNFRPPFNILMVLYLSFCLENPFIALLILVIQYIHYLFSANPWAFSTFTGVLVCMAINYLRDLMQLSSAFITVILVQVFQMVWFVIEAAFLYFSTSNWYFVADKFYRFIPESIFLSITAPFLFMLLEKIWKFKERNILGEDI